jgi:hypothetical protein
MTEQTTTTAAATSNGCCAPAGAATTPTRTTGTPCCGTAEAATQAGACCDPAAKTEALAAAASCCGPTATTTAVPAAAGEQTASTAHADPAGLPVVVIGAGPVGLAAAAHLHERGLPFLVLEAGGEVGASVRQWGQVRLFSPWRYDVDAAARRLLDAAGRDTPDPQVLPTGADLVEHYLAPLAKLPAIAPYLRLDTRVVAISRLGVDRVRTAGRDNAPFVVRLADGTDLTARAVIDASGTWTHPNVLGANGLPAHGESGATPAGTPSWSAPGTPPPPLSWPWPNSPNRPPAPPSPGPSAPAARRGPTAAKPTTHCPPAARSAAACGCWCAPAGSASSPGSPSTPSAPSPTAAWS